MAKTYKRPKKQTEIKVKPRPKRKFKRPGKKKMNRRDLIDPMVVEHGFG